MRFQIYNFFVNRHPGICERYHRFHDNAAGIGRTFSWLYLLWLNFAYYILFCHFLGKTKEPEFYEQKKVELKSYDNRIEFLSEQSIYEAASGCDIISFDIFDTLLFRPFSDPTDLFLLVGEKLGIMNFREIRKMEEKTARKISYAQKSHYEVSMKEIYRQIESELGLPAEKGMEAELDAEYELCFANPFMLEVYQKLLQSGKKIIITSDMYLPKVFLEKLLEKNGFKGYEKLYVSNEYGKSKANGTLYAMIAEEYPTGTAFLHIGDNVHSDLRNAGRAGWKALHYPNVNECGKGSRPYDMSALVGGAYRGIVNSSLYQQPGRAFTSAYEYGYIYGGLFVLGYCNFIHEYCTLHEIDKILFLSRDGFTLKKVYDFLYPQQRTEYVYWSRKAAVKLSYCYDRYDFYRRFLYHKVNSGVTLQDVFKSMELTFLLDETWQNGVLHTCDGRVIMDAVHPEVHESSELKTKGLRPEDKLTSRNVEQVKEFLMQHHEEILIYYEPQQSAAKRYYSHILRGCEKAAAVDIGWAGSGAIALSNLAEKIWNIPCEITGLIAGTNTLYNAETESSESFLQSGKLVAYLYSQRHNRDLWKKHDPNKNYNVYWELLLSSNFPQFLGFYEGEQAAENIPALECKYDKELGITYAFGKTDPNPDGIRDIQQGIYDFCRQYKDHFQNYEYMFSVSGRDAYAPMLIAASYHEKYLKQIASQFAIVTGVE